MKRFITISLMLTCLVAYTFAQSIVGTWKATPETIKNIPEFEENKEGKTYLFFTFNADNTFNTLIDYRVDAKQNTIPIKAVIKISIPGDYEIQNNTLITKIKSKKITSTVNLSFPGEKKEVSDLLMKAINPIMQKRAKEMTKQLRKNKEGAELNIQKYSIRDNVLTLDDEMVFTKEM